MASSESKPYYVYLLSCSDGSLYCGIALDPIARLKQHNSGKGAKYTKSRGPCTLVYREGPYTYGQALSREASIKKLKRSDKLKLISEYSKTEL